MSQRTATRLAWGSFAVSLVLYGLLETLAVVTSPNAVPAALHSQVGAAQQLFSWSFLPFVFQQDGAVVFSVTDDGKGFVPTAAANGSGLQNMADRVEALGGSLIVSATVGAGTSVTGRVPASAPEPVA